MKEMLGGTKIVKKFELISQPAPIYRRTE
jgi:hypothetical protein